VTSQVELHDPPDTAAREPVDAAVRVEPGGGATVLVEPGSTTTVLILAGAAATVRVESVRVGAVPVEAVRVETVPVKTVRVGAAPVGAVPVGAGADPGPARAAGTNSQVGWLWLLRIALVGYGAFMSLWRLDVPSWNSDEVVYLQAGDNYWNGQFGYNPEHPPLGKWLIGAAERLFGQSLWAARLPSALAMLAGGVLLWVWLARRIGPAAGRTAAVLWWSLPALTTFPEALGQGGPDLGQAQRWALLDPLAAVLALAAVVAGWWWVRSGRLSAALCCGLLAGAAVATKLPALLLVAVPGAVGPLATLLRPLPALPGLPLLARLPGAGRIALPRWAIRPGWARPEWVVLPGRVVGHAAVWLAAGAGAFAATYLPMGYHQGLAVFWAGWHKQHLHAAVGHQIFLHGTAYGRSPWWSLAWWQYAAVGGAVTVVALIAVAAGLALRSGLTAYLTAAWLLPMVALVPLSHLALPHYDLIWRPVLVAGCVAGGATAARWLRRRTHLVVAVAAVLALLAPAVLLGVRTTAHTARVRPAGYSALPALAGPGEVQVVGNVLVARRYLPHRQVNAVRNAPRAHRPAPGTIVLDRASTLRGGDFGLSAWARLHHYRHTVSGTLDIWARPRG
jgi:4-amino-4-deoxy-L-arabinose transferase-like glycosyltransferase